MQAVRTGEGGECQNGLLKPQANKEIDQKLKDAQQCHATKSRSRFCFDRRKETKTPPKVVNLCLCIVVLMVWKLIV